MGNNNYVVVKQTKSYGIAILLTFLLGPVGLFYASILGGFIMTLTPIALCILMVKGLFTGSLNLLYSSLFLFIIICISYWIICIIWSVIAIKNYNQKIIKGAIQQHISKPTYAQKSVHNHYSDSNKNFEIQKGNQRPLKGDWLKENPDKTLNDYFNIFKK
jgi:hypothetical protein